MKNSFIFIPARYASSRFPAKPLANINGKPMIQYVFESCHQACDQTYVVTDSLEIEEAVKTFGGNVLRVDDDVANGSERILVALGRFGDELGIKEDSLILNVQGDEPLMEASIIKDLLNFHRNNFHFDIVTIAKKQLVIDENFYGSDVVKLVKTLKGECLYFSRAPIPHGRDSKIDFWWQHIGVYSYKLESLKSIMKLPASRIEQLECLEQMRALENGYKIGAVETEVNLIGVDTPADLIKVENVLKEKI